MKLLKNLTLLSLFLFPFGEILRFDLGNNIAIRVLDVTVGLTTICFILLSIKNKKPAKSYLKKPILIFSFVAFISLIVNLTWINPSQFFVAILYFVRWISYACIFFVISSLDKKFKKTINKILLFDGLLILILGFVQYFLYPNLRNLYYLGWDEHNYRMFSVFLDPNFAGAFFVLFLLFLVGLMHTYLGTKQKMYTILLAAISIFTLIAIFLTYSRSAILMLAAGLSVYLILIGKEKFLPTLFIGIIAVIVFLTPTYNKENTNLFRVTSSMARVETYNNSLKIIKDHPFFGVGFNAYRYAQQKYKFRPVETKYSSHADAGVDNSFLFVLVTTGIMGFLAYINIWKEILVKNKKSTVLIASILGLFINSFFINSLFFPSIMLWMWVLIGISEDY